MQFLLMSRVTEPLNAALAAISLVHLENAADKPREYWQERSTGEVLGVLNLVNAWHALIRFKLGELLPEQHIRPFQVQDLLDWVSYQLELTNPLRAEKNLMVEASQESLQEALLMLYSAVYTLGPNVHLVVQNVDNGVWFRVRYARTGKDCPNSLDELLATLDGNWRLEDTAFELRTAADFIALSGSKLHIQGTEQFCEMAFFVYAVGKRPPEPFKRTEISAPPPIDTGDALISSVIRAPSDDATKPLPMTFRMTPSKTLSTTKASDQTEPPAPTEKITRDKTTPDTAAASALAAPTPSTPASASKEETPQSNVGTSESNSDRDARTASPARDSEATTDESAADASPKAPEPPPPPPSPPSP